MPFEPAIYRLKVAHGFLDESRQDVELGRFRSAVDNAQLAVENAAKAALALVLPVGKTHNPARLPRGGGWARHLRTGPCTFSAARWRRPLPSAGLRLRAATGFILEWSMSRVTI